MHYPLPGILSMFVRAKSDQTLEPQRQENTKLYVPVLCNVAIFKYEGGVDHLAIERGHLTQKPFWFATPVRGQTSALLNPHFLLCTPPPSHTHTHTITCNILSGGARSRAPCVWERKQSAPLQQSSSGGSSSAQAYPLGSKGILCVAMHADLEGGEKNE